MIGRIIFGLTTYSVGMYTFNYYYRIKLLPAHSHLPSEQSSNVTPSADYDSLIGWDEILLGMPSIRRDLVSRASGSALETAAGTCRNLMYYGPVSALQITDCNLEMLGKALEKYKKDGSSLEKDAPISFRVVMNAESLKYPNQVFDSVVQTFGLCSCSDPVTELKEISRVTKMGGILLLFCLTR